MAILPAVGRVNVMTLGVRVVQPLSSGAAAAVWYDPNGTFAAAGMLPDIWAWRAIDTPGSPWGAGPANYAASLIDENLGLALVEGNGAVPWGALTGWGFVAAAAQYFNTGLSPTNDQSWSIFVQFLNGVFLGANAALCGAGPANGRIFGLYYSNAANARVTYWNGASQVPAPALLTGNLGVGGNQGYRNGVPDGGAIGAWTGNVAGLTTYIGAINILGPIFFATANIAAVWICRSNPAIVAGDVAALVLAMGQL